MLKVEGLRAGYGSINILWDLSFEVREGDYLCILGENGSGKSTLVKALLGLKSPNSGEIKRSGGQ